MTHWDKPISLFEEMTIPDDVRPFTNDYRINLFEIAFLNPEKVKKFQSDFREVADYFVQKRLKKKYIPSYRALNHVDEVLKFLSAMSGDDRFVSLDLSREKGEVTMCDIVDGFVSQGLSQGLSQGNARTLIQCIEALMQSEGISVYEACEKLHRSINDYEEAKEAISMNYTI